MNSPANSCSAPGKAKIPLPTTVFSLAGMSGKSWVRSLVTFAAGLALVALLCRRLEFRATFALLTHTSLPLLGLSVAAIFTFYILRAARWVIILKGKVGFLALFMYSSIGYLVSSVAPAQAGELVKPALVQARHGLPYFATAASVAVERLLDVATLFLLGVAAMFALPRHALGPAWIVASLKAGGLLCGLGFLILALSSRWAGGILRIVSKVLSRLRLPPSINDRITGMARMFLQGAGGALSPLSLFYALLCSVAVWGVHAAGVALIFWAVNGHVASLAVVLFGFTVFSFGMAIPLTPAYVGQYEGVWLLVFAGLHVAPKDDVLPVGLLCHGLILLTIAFFGLLSLAILRVAGTSGSLPGERPGQIPDH